MNLGDVGALGFWIFLASIIVAGIWEKSRREAERHETLRRIVEKTGMIDEAKLKELFSAAPPEEIKPGSGYRTLRITGTIIMFLGAGLAIIFATMGLVLREREAFAAVAIAFCTALVGLGVFFSSRFAEPPPGSRIEPPAR